MALRHKESRVRPWTVFVAAVTFCSGCTHLELKRTTVQQGSTLTDLQFQQVLDNLAMFACNPDAMAWHLKLSSGTVQVTNQVSGAFLASLPSAVSDHVKYLFNPSVGAQRGLLGQWNVVPAVETEDLKALQLAYQKAIFPLDETGTIRDAIYDLICELTVKYNVLLTPETVYKLLDHARQKKCETVEELQTRKWELKRKFQVLYKDFDEQLDLLAKLSDPNNVKFLGQRLLEERQQNLRQKVIEERQQSRQNTGKWSSTEGDKKADLQKADMEANRQITAHRRQADMEANRQITSDKDKILEYRKGIGDQISNLVRELCDLPYIQRYAITGTRGEHNTAVIGQIQNKIKALVELAEEPKFAIPWLCVGKWKYVPKCACYVGHCCKCGCDCYVWVMPENRAILRDFTLTVLTLAPLVSQEIPAPFPGGGVAYSPVTAGASPIPGQH
jgi:hypothetical protein